MTMKIFEPTYTQIPNIVFDYWMEKLSPAEFKVLLCICRKTFGWHKAKDKISLRMLEKLTGLSKKGITKNISALLEYGLIHKISSVTEDGDPSANEYEVLVHEIIKENNIGRELSTLPPPTEYPGVVNSVHRGVVYSVHQQKKEKENKDIEVSKDTSSPRSPKVKDGEKDELRFSLEEKKFIGLQKEDFDRWEIAYPSITNLPSEIQKATEWLLGEPSRAKKTKAWRKFINAWLRRANEYHFNRSIPSSTPRSSNPPQVEQNINLLNRVLQDVPDLREETKRYGNKCVFIKLANDSLYFDMNPSEFEAALFKMTGVYRKEKS